MQKSRRRLLAGLLLVFLVSFVNMNLKFDPLARNASVNASNRAVLIKRLSSDDLQYLVENSVDVNDFIEFVEEPLFLLANYKGYRQAMDAKPSTTREIVTFVNAVINKIGMEELLEAIPNYSYSALRKLVVDRSPYNHNASIVLNPNLLTTDLDLKSSIGEYEPSDLVALVEVSGLARQSKDLMLRKEASQGLGELCLYLTSLYGEDCAGFVVDQAYLSYFTIQDNYLHVVESEGPQAAFDAWGLPSHNEHQLGLSVDLWNRNGESMEYLDQYHSLQSVAAEFGFIFYGTNEKLPFHHLQKGNHLRFVGVDEAKACQSGNCFYQR